MLLLLARFETAKFFQDGDISVPLIPKDLLDDCCCCCSLLTLLDPCLSTSPTKEDIPLRDLQPFKGWYSSPLMFPVPGGFVSHVAMTFVKLLLLLLILPFKLVDDIGIPLSSDMLLLVVLNKNESKCYAFDIDENSMILRICLQNKRSIIITLLLMYYPRLLLSLTSNHLLDLLLRMHSSVVPWKRIVVGEAFFCHSIEFQTKT